MVVLGLLGVVGVLAVGTGFAEDENAAGAKCSEATLPRDVSVRPEWG